MRGGRERDDDDDDDDVDGREEDDDVDEDEDDDDDDDDDEDESDEDDEDGCEGRVSGVDEALRSDGGDNDVVGVWDDADEDDDEDDADEDDDEESRDLYWSIGMRGRSCSSVPGGKSGLVVSACSLTSSSLNEATPGVKPRS